MERTNYHRQGEHGGPTQKLYTKEMFQLCSRFLAVITRYLNTASSIVASLIHLSSIYSGLCGHSSGENHLLKRNEHGNRLKDHISWGAGQWGRNNARPGARRRRAALLHGMEVDGVSHQFCEAE